MTSSSTSTFADSEASLPKVALEYFTSSWGKDQAQFMQLGKQTVGSLNLPQLGRYLKHLQEELNEVAKASEQGKAVDLVDGLCDTIVIALGAMHSLGVDPDVVWDAVFAANMRKFPEGELFYRPDGQIGKPPGWYGPEKALRRHLKEVGVPEELTPLV